MLSIYSEYILCLTRGGRSSLIINERQESTRGDLDREGGVYYGYHLEQMKGIRRDDVEYRRLLGSLLSFLDENVHVVLENSLNSPAQ